MGKGGVSEITFMREKEFKIKKLEKEDVLIFQKMTLMFQEVFEITDHTIPALPYLQRLLETPSFIAYAVVHKNDVVAGLTAYELPLYYSDFPEMFLYDIAVREDFQRKGLGKKLLVSLQNYCQTKNIKLMFVAANEEDKHAIEFYHSTGGYAEKVVHFNYPIE